MMTSIVNSLLGAAALSFAAMGASAATITLAGGGTTDSCSLSNMTTSLACDGDFGTANPGGNVESSDLNGLFLADGVAINGWSEVDRLGDFDQGGTAGDQLSDGGAFSFTDDSSGGLSGTWMLENFTFDPNKFYVFALKGGRDSAAYFMDGSFESGFWTDDDLDGALSNVRLFNVDGDGGGGGGENPNVIPVPASLPLLLGALGLSGFVLNRRKRKA